MQLITNVSVRAQMRISVLTKAHYKINVCPRTLNGSDEQDCGSFATPKSKTSDSLS